MNKAPLLLALTLGLLVAGLFPELHNAEALTGNGVTLVTWFNTPYNGYMVYVASPTHYNFTQKFGYGVFHEGRRSWNLTRLDTSPTEMELMNIDWLYYSNGTAITSSHYEAATSYTNTTFSDSLGSGVLLNVTYTANVASDKTLTLFQLWKFYPTFITQNITVKNTYDAKLRRLVLPKLLYSPTLGSSGLSVGAGATMRISGMGAEEGLKGDDLASVTTTLRTPSFIYNTAVDKGIVLDVVDHHWDWTIANNAYQVSPQSVQLYIQAYDSGWSGGDFDKIYKQLSLNEKLQVGTLFIQFTSRQIDSAYLTLGSVYTTLYQSRNTPTFAESFMPHWNSWSAYAETATWTNIKAEVDYLALHPELGIKTIQLDECWSEEWGKWTTLHSGFSATETLPSIVNYIKSKGFKVGLWLAPWGVGTWALSNSTVKSWLLNSTVDGLYLNRTADLRYSTDYYINPTTPAARAFITNQLLYLVSLGVTFFKLDFMELVEVTQRYYTEITRAEWMEYVFNITEVLPKSTVIAYSAIPIWQYGMKQPYFSQRFWNVVRISYDTTNLVWTSQMRPSYKDYHFVAPIFNYLSVVATTDQLGDDLRFGNNRPDAEWKFNLMYHRLGPYFEWSNGFTTGNATKMTWVTNTLTTIPYGYWKQYDYWLNGGVNRIWLHQQGSTYYVMVLNPTDSTATVTVSFTNFGFSISNYKIEEYTFTTTLSLLYASVPNSFSFDSSLAIRGVKVYVITNLGETVITSDNNKTFYLRGDSWTTNTITAYELDEINSNIPRQANTTKASAVAQVDYGIRLWLVHSSGTTTEVTLGTPTIIKTFSGTFVGLSSGTWNCPKTFMVLGFDAVELTVYAKLGSDAWAAQASFITTVPIFSKQLLLQTWTFQLTLNVTMAATTFAQIKFGDNTNPSYITNVGFLTALTPEIQAYYLQKGDMINWLLYGYTAILGQGIFFGILLLIWASTTYVRYRNFASVLVGCIIFGGAGGLLWAFVPAPVVFGLWIFLLLGLAVVIFRVIR